jgi:hypothetical protein
VRRACVELAVKSTSAKGANFAARKSVPLPIREKKGSEGKREADARLAGYGGLAATAAWHPPFGKPFGATNSE